MVSSSTLSTLLIRSFSTCRSLLPSQVSITLTCPAPSIVDRSSSSFCSVWISYFSRSDKGSSSPPDMSLPRLSFTDEFPLAEEFPIMPLSIPVSPDIPSSVPFFSTGIAMTASRSPTSTRINSWSFPGGQYFSFIFPASPLTASILSSMSPPAPPIHTHW